VQINFDADDLRPAIEIAVRETLEKIAEMGSGLIPAQRLAFSEKEAAAILGIRPNVLGDARRRGEVCGSLVGKKYLYSRDELIAFLERRRDGEREG
jgi:hypothetical protein